MKPNQRSEENAGHCHNFLVKSAMLGSTAKLPWLQGAVPLMLAPMQGITNRALRAHFVAAVQPDVVFTEYVRIPANKGGHSLSNTDRLEIEAQQLNAPLVVQLFGLHPENLVSAASTIQSHGVQHINLNLGCPYGRMGAGRAGGVLLRQPEKVMSILTALRAAVSGSLSVKLRAGFEAPDEVLALLPVFEQVGVDFLVLHPRTVVQEYRGCADHHVTAQVVAGTSLPVIANGDIRTAAEGLAVLTHTRAAGLMLGRGAIADPTIFARLRARDRAVPPPAIRRAAFAQYLEDLRRRYAAIFCGDAQILQKLKEVLTFVDDPELVLTAKRLRRTKKCTEFSAVLAQMAMSAETPLLATN
jgi:tRNA-dihydrouridine synthase B